ncbi:unnamed protein product [Moneuplotes crassus]|uniref:Uncharacterized protein n=1 Tax=Euplotes crassus TaxID=5936 RepID=A0AAD1X4V0_EUPCR|nr:unnamed protein product [Moneuplotes crassus]
MKSIHSANKFPIDFFDRSDESPVDKGSYGQALKMDSVELKPIRSRNFQNKFDTFSKYSYYSFLKNTPHIRNKVIASQNNQYRSKDLGRKYEGLRSSKSSRGNYNSSPIKKNMLCRSQEDAILISNKGYGRQNHSSRIYKAPIVFTNDKTPSHLFLSANKGINPVSSFAPGVLKQVSTSAEGLKSDGINRSTKLSIQNKLLNPSNPYCREKNDGFNNDSSLKVNEQSIETINGNFFTSKSLNEVKINLKSPSIYQRNLDLDRKLNLYHKIKVQRRTRPLQKIKGPKTLEIPGFSKKKRVQNAIKQVESLHNKRNLWNPRSYLKHSQIAKKVISADCLKNERSESEEMMNSTAEFYKPSSQDSDQRESRSSLDKLRRNEVKIVPRVKSENTEIRKSKPQVSSKACFNAYGKKVVAGPVQQQQKFQMYSPHIMHQKKLWASKGRKIWEKLRMRNSKNLTKKENSDEPLKLKRYKICGSKSAKKLSPVSNSASRYKVNRGLASESQEAYKNNIQQSNKSITKDKPKSIHFRKIQFEGITNTFLINETTKSTRQNIRHEEYRA